MDTILATLAQTLKESTETQAGDLVKAKIAIDGFLTILSEKPAAFEHCATVALLSIKSAYKSQFTDMMARIQGNVIKRALTRMNLFATTLDKSIPAKTKGLYYPEYKAAARKKGQHNGSRVVVNFNRTVADAFRYSTETLLKRLFTTGNKSAGVAERSAKDLLNKCHDGMKDVFNELHTDFQIRAIEAHLSQYTISSLNQQLVRRKRELEAMIEAVKGKIGKVYGDASVSLMTDIMRAWNETYLRAASVKGSGARDDLIEILGESLEDGGVVGSVLERLSEKMREQISEVMLSLRGRLG